MQNKLQVGDECRIINFVFGEFDDEIGIIVGINEVRSTDILYWVKLKSGRKFTDVMPEIKGNAQADGYIWSWTNNYLQLIKQAKKCIKVYRIVKFLEKI